MSNEEQSRIDKRIVKKQEESYHKDSINLTQWGIVGSPGDREPVTIQYKLFSHFINT